MNSRINFKKWRQLTTLRIREVAALMEGYDPGELEDGSIVINEQGDPPDLDHTERMLMSAVLTADIEGAGAGYTSPNRMTHIKVGSLCPWLEQHGYGDLAHQLQNPNEADGTRNSRESEPERRLKRLLDLGGSAMWNASKSRWQFKRFGDLVAAEAEERRGRHSDKTVRSDLVIAMEAQKAKQREDGHAVFFSR